MEIFILKEDKDCTLRSSLTPTGFFVTSEDEARRWVEDGKGKGWYGSDIPRSYQKIEHLKKSKCSRMTTDI